MPITFSCPSGHRVTAGQQQVGQAIRCPECGQMVSVPESTEPSTSAEPNGREPAPLDFSLVRAVQGEAHESQGPPPLRAGRPAIGPRRRKGRRRASTKGRPAARRARKGPAAAPEEEPTAAAPLAAGASAGAVRSLPEPPPLPGPPRRRRPAAPAHFYRADRGKLQTVRWLAFLLALVVAFGALPAVKHLNLGTAPGWARGVLLLAALEAFYVLWMLVTPDWASVWVVMVVFALAAALYAAAMALALATPLDKPMPLQMGPLRHSAPRWCAAVMLLSLLATYLSGRASVRWRRAIELEIGSKNRS